MALIIKKVLVHKRSGFPTSTTYYLSVLSDTGWTEDEALATKFGNMTGNAFMAALHASVTERGEGEEIELTAEVVEGEPTPSEAAAMMGSLGGKSTTEAKKLAVRENGRKGGRPKGSKTKNKETNK